MRTIKFPLILVIAIAAVFTFASCSDDDDVDNTKPVINLIAPAEGSVLKIGKDIHFDAVFTDDVMLKSYTVEIHDNFNGHTHTRSASDDKTVDFFLKKTWSLEGKKNASIHHHEIIIPENATPGKYHLIVSCLDAAGNESYVTRNIELSHDGEEGGHHH